MRKLCRTIDSLTEKTHEAIANRLVYWSALHCMESLKLALSGCLDYSKIPSASVKFEDEEEIQAKIKSCKLKICEAKHTFITDYRPKNAFDEIQEIIKHYEEKAKLTPKAQIEEVMLSNPGWVKVDKMPPFDLEFAKSLKMLSPRNEFLEFPMPEAELIGPFREEGDNDFYWISNYKNKSVCGSELQLAKDRFSLCYTHEKSNTEFVWRAIAKMPILDILSEEEIQEVQEIKSHPIFKSLTVDQLNQAISTINGTLLLAESGKNSIKTKVSFVIGKLKISNTLGLKNLEGMLEGGVVMNLPDGRIFEGRLKDGMLDGMGTLTFPDGRVFQAEIVLDPKNLNSNPFKIYDGNQIYKRDDQDPEQIEEQRDSISHDLIGLKILNIIFSLVSSKNQKENSFEMPSGDAVNSQPQVPEISETSESAYHAKIKLLRERISREAKKGELEIDTLLLINEALIDIAHQRFGEIVARNRAERRKLLGKDPKAYEKSVIQAYRQTQKLLSEKLHKVIEDCSCDYALFFRSSKNWVKKNLGFQNGILLIIGELTIKIASEDKPKMTPEFAKEVLKFQVQELERFDVNLEVKDTKHYSLVRSSWVDDLVFAKFGIESEDLIKSLEDLQADDDEIRQLCQQLHNLVLDRLKRVIEEKDKPQA